MVAGHAAEKFVSAQEGGDGKRDCLLRHFVQGGKATIQDLLLAAHPVQRHNLHWKWVSQVGWRIVESKVAIRAYAE
jgi:hypothetical protein